jgi:hypothetical protein
MLDIIMIGLLIPILLGLLWLMVKPASQRNTSDVRRTLTTRPVVTSPDEGSNNHLEIDNFRVGEREVTHRRTHNTHVEE